MSEGETRKRILSLHHPADSNIEVYIDALRDAGYEVVAVNTVFSAIMEVARDSRWDLLLIHAETHIWNFQILVRSLLALSQRALKILYLMRSDALPPLEGIRDLTWLTLPKTGHKARQVVANVNELLRTPQGQHITTRPPA